MTGPMWMPMQPPTVGRLLAWNPQPVPIFAVGCLAVLLLYLFGVAALKRRGVAWPRGRTVNFLIGIVLIAAVTVTGIGGYAMMTFSVHMGQHMVLNMLAPIFLLWGAPVTLALRVLPGKSTARRLLLTVLHSRFTRIMTSPALTISVFLLSLYGMYFTPILDWAMSNWITHTWMLLHFVIVGLLFFWPIMGIDPGPRRHSYPVRIAELVFIMPFHAFFGIAIMMSSDVLNTAFTHRPVWGIDPLSDQYTGGAIAWAFSEIPTLIVLIVVLQQWIRSDERAARRHDRQADRDGDAELTRYNDYLRSLTTPPR